MQRFVVYLCLLAVALPFVSANHVQTGSGRTVAFDHKTGNEWWVEVVLSGQDSGSVAEVWAQPGELAWQRLEKKSWGSWGASFHIGAGAMVRFQARWTDGDVLTSCYFTHPAGTERCDMPPTTTAAPFDASFSNVKGNEWWVEAKVTANQPIATVHARVNCGTTWKALTLRSWGSWAASFNVPTNSKVDFLATSTRGNQEISGGYVWPQATPTSACGTTTTSPTPTTSKPAPTTTTPTPVFDAKFSNVKGNDWWVEAKVTANQAVSGVEARIDCAGAWKPLTLRSWGAWASSFNVPSGSIVDLRARSSSGAVDLSGGYEWPSAVPAAACFTATWPKEGSFADYSLKGEQVATDPDGTTSRFTFDGIEHIEWSAANGWTVTCDVDFTELSHPAGGTPTWTNWSETFTESYAPPRAPVPATIGSTVRVEVSNGCFIVTSHQVVDEHASRQTRIRATAGEPVTVSAYHVVDSTLENEYEYYWESKMGMLFEWSESATHTDGTSEFAFFAEAYMLDTDAPIR